MILMTNETNKGAVWVVAELKSASVQAVSLQLVGKARTLADELGVGVEAILLGDKLEDFLIGECV